MANLTRRETTPRRLFHLSPPGWFDRDLGELFESHFDAPMIFRDACEHVPRFDIAETETAVEVTIDVPGMKSDEIDIEVIENVLTVRGEHTEEKKEDNGKKFHRVERQSGSFSRSVRLPCVVDEGKVEAELAEGVLTVTLLRLAEARPCKVRIKG